MAATAEAVRWRGTASWPAPHGWNLFDAAAAMPPLLSNGWTWAADFGRSWADFTSLSCSWPLLVSAPAGDGHPVMVIPGLCTDDTWTTLLRGFLEQHGYQAYGWDLGANRGTSAQVVTGMARRVDEITQRHGRAMSIIGWSLGGLFARRQALRTPEAVRQVITLGSPLCTLCGEAPDAVVEPLDDPASPPCGTRVPAAEASAVPTTSVYSRWDGVVPWEGCLNPHERLTENIEIYSSHFGFGTHPAALWAIADRLAQPIGGWHVFEPPVAMRAAYPAPQYAPAT
ncbi:MAG TPA: hypothetical protein VF265_03895 [Nevskiaceae bacterium]